MNELVAIEDFHLAASPFKDILTQFQIAKIQQIPEKDVYQCIIRTRYGQPTLDIISILPGLHSKLLQECEEAVRFQGSLVKLIDGDIGSGKTTLLEMLISKAIQAAIACEKVITVSRMNIGSARFTEVKLWRQMIANLNPSITRTLYEAMRRNDTQKAKKVCNSLARPEARNLAKATFILAQKKAMDESFNPELYLQMLSSGFENYHINVRIRDFKDALTAVFDLAEGLGMGVMTISSFSTPNASSVPYYKILYEDLLKCVHALDGFCLFVIDETEVLIESTHTDYTRSIFTEFYREWIDIAIPLSLGLLVASTPSNTRSMMKLEPLKNRLMPINHDMASTRSPFVSLGFDTNQTLVMLGVITQIYLNHLKNKEEYERVFNFISDNQEEIRIRILRTARTHRMARSVGRACVELLDYVTEYNALPIEHIESQMDSINEALSEYEGIDNSIELNASDEENSALENESPEGVTGPSIAPSWMAVRKEEAGVNDATECEKTLTDSCSSLPPLFEAGHLLHSSQEHNVNHDENVNKTSNSSEEDCFGAFGVTYNSEYDDIFMEDHGADGEVDAIVPLKKIVDKEIIEECRWLNIIVPSEYRTLGLFKPTVTPEPDVLKKHIYRPYGSLFSSVISSFKVPAEFQSQTAQVNTRQFLDDVLLDMMNNDVVIDLYMGIDESGNPVWDFSEDAYESDALFYFDGESLNSIASLSSLKHAFVHKLIAIALNNNLFKVPVGIQNISMALIDYVLVQFITANGYDYLTLCDAPLPNRSGDIKLYDVMQGKTDADLDCIAACNRRLYENVRIQYSKSFIRATLPKMSARIKQKDMFFMERQTRFIVNEIDRLTRTIEERSAQISEEGVTFQEVVRALRLMHAFREIMDSQYIISYQHTKAARLIQGLISIWARMTQNDLEDLDKRLKDRFVSEVTAFLKELLILFIEKSPGFASSGSHSVNRDSTKLLLAMRQHAVLIDIGIQYPELKLQGTGMISTIRSYYGEKISLDDYLSLLLLTSHSSGKFASELKSLTQKS